MSLEQWKDIFALADTHGFVIASDECYSELYYDEAHPPLGALQAAQLLGRTDYRGLVVFSSLSKRSNAPGLRSGFVAGDAQILKKFLLYRTYHGGAMGLAVQHASIAAWSDEAHVIANRAAYAAKYRAMLPLLPVTLQTRQPEGGFYLWIQLSTDDVQFTQQLLAEQNVLVLPGSLLARECNGINPGKNHVRVALVAPLEECVEAAHRMRTFISK
jgi:N-succinyldiaminopimelate aminotransferase